MTTMATEPARIDAAGLSTMITAAGLFTFGKPRKGFAGELPKFCRVRIAGGGGIIGLESTDGHDSRFTAIATNRGYVPHFGAGIDAESISSICKGGGFDSATIGDDRFTTRGLSVSVSQEMEPWAVAVADPDSVDFRVVIDAGTFGRIAREVAIAADDASARYALGGVAIETESPAPGERYGRTHAIATDGRRLHCLTIPRSSIGTNGTAIIPGLVIIPAHIITRAAKAISGSIARGVDPESVAVTIDAGAIGKDGNRDAVSIHWTAGDFTATITARPIMGRFPRWRDVMVGDAARGAIVGDAGARPETISTWSADAKSVANACRDAVKGVCKPTNRGEQPKGVDFAAGEIIPGSAGDRFPRMSADALAGSFDRVMGAGKPDNVGLASPGFSVRLNPQFIVDASVGFNRGESIRLVTLADDVGRNAVVIRRGRGYDSENAIGFTAVIMPLNR